MGSGRHSFQLRLSITGLVKLFLQVICQHLIGEGSIPGIIPKASQAAVLATRA